MEEVEESEIIQSEAVRDFLENIPSWIIRWGMIIIFIILLAVISSTWWISSPDMVTAEFTLSSFDQPRPIVSKIDGRLERVFIKENQKVKSGEILAYMESYSNHTELLQLEKQLEQFDKYIINDEIGWRDISTFPKYLHLGNVQDSYQNFRQNYVQTYSLFKEGYFEKRKNLLEKDIEDINKINRHLNEQVDLYIKDVEISEKEYKINKRLLNDKVIAEIDLYREESKLIGKKFPVKNIQSTIMSNNALLNTKKRELLDLENSVILQKEAFIHSLNTLRSNIDQWKNMYLLIAPFDGVINLAQPFQEKQIIQANSEILYISTSNKSFMGNLKIPQMNIGKVEKGQKVLIKFQGYPFEEFGSIHGEITSIAELSSVDDQFFWATVSLPRGLSTDTQKKIRYKTGMKASAEIITKELRLIERLFYNTKRHIVNTTQ